MKRKLFAILMSAMMLVSFMPAMAFAVEEEAVVAAKVAKIGTTEYETLADAFAAAKDGDTVKLLDNVTLSSRVDVAMDTGSITVDLNKKQIESTAECINGSVFNIVSGTVTIKNGKLVGIEGPKKLDNPSDKECDVITVRNGAVANLEGLDVEVDTKTGACAYAFAEGKIYVMSGKYTNKSTAEGTEKMLLNQADNSDQVIFVSGGTFFGENPMNGDNSGTPSTFLADGAYSVVNRDGSFTIRVNKTFVNYKAVKRSAIETFKEASDTQAITDKIDAAIAALDAYRFTAAKSEEDMQAEMDKIRTDLMAEINPMKYEIYVAAKKSAIEEKGVGASVEIQAIVAGADVKFAAVTYDATISLAKNKSAVDKVYNELLSQINEQQAVELKVGVNAVSAVQRGLVANKNGKIVMTFDVLSANGSVITGYQIYRSTAKSFKKNVKKYNSTLADVTKTSKIWTNAKSLKKGTKYYYKVRGVVTLPNGKKAYTQWSNIKSVKCKKSR